MIEARKREELDSAVLEALSKGGVFYSEGYHQYLKSLGDRPLFMFDGNFLLLFVVKNRGPFRFARLPVEYLRLSEEGEPDARQFLDACIDYSRDVLKLHWIHHPETTARFQATPSRCVKIPYSNHILDTGQSLDVIWSGFPKKNRYMIRRAQQSDVEYKVGGAELLEDFYAVYVHTANRTGLKPLSKAYLEKQFAYFGDQIKVAVAYHQGEPMGGEFGYYDSHMWYCMYSGTVLPSVTGITNSILWVLIQAAVNLNVEKFSLVGARINPAPGSKYEGINRFKSNICRNIEPCFLFKTVLNQRMYQLYRALVRARAYLKNEKLPQDIIDQEIGQWLDINDPQLLYEVYGKMEH